MDAAARERALEARVAELELRLRRLELAQGGAAAVPVPPAMSTTAAFTVPSTAPAAPPPPPRLAAGPRPRPLPESPRGSPRRGRPPKLLRQSRRTRPTPRPEPQRPPPKPRVTVSLADLEARLTGRALAWVGGLALVLGAIFFLSLAFTRGWIGPEARVVIGLIGGAVSLGAGALFMDRRNRLLGHVLTPVGLAIISISLVGATRLYGLIPVELGLLLALASSIAAAAVAVRANSPIVAAFGLIAVLAAPPLLGATPDMVTLAFVAVVLVGTTGVALWRSWPWLPIVAFLLAAPQLASWITGDPAPIAGFIGLVGFWLINLVAAAGEEARRHRDDLSASSATLMLANAAFLVWAGFALLDGELLMYRGPFLVLIALAHLGVGLAFIRRDGEADLFGLLTVGTGLAALSMAAPVQFGADAIPLAWTAEAVALAWVAARRGHPYSAMVASGLYVLAGAYLVQSFGLSALDGTESPTVKLAASLAFFIAGTGVGLWFLRDRSLRYAASAYAVVIAVFCASLRLDGVPVLVVLTIAFVVAAALPSILALLPDRPIQWQTSGLIRADLRATNWRPAAEMALPMALILTIALATLVMVTRVYGPTSPIALDGIPFVDAAGGALAIYLAGLAMVAWLLDDKRFREPIAALGLLVTAWAVARALDDVAVVVAWSALVVGGFALWRGLRSIATGPRRVLSRRFGIELTADGLLPAAAVLVYGFAVLHLLAFELPIFDIGGALPAVPFTDAGTIGAVSLAVAALLAGAIVGGRAAWRAPILVAGVILAYLVPVRGRPVGRRRAVVRVGHHLGRRLASGARQCRRLPRRRARDHARGGDAGHRRGRPAVASQRGHDPGRRRHGPAGARRVGRIDERVGRDRLGRPPAPVGALDQGRRRGDLRVPGLSRTCRHRRPRGRRVGLAGGAADVGPGRAERAVGRSWPRRLRVRPALADRGSAARRSRAARAGDDQGLPGRPVRARRRLPRGVPDRARHPAARGRGPVAARPARQGPGHPKLIRR